MTPHPSKAEQILSGVRTLFVENPELITPADNHGLEQISIAARIPAQTGRHNPDTSTMVPYSAYKRADTYQLMDNPQEEWRRSAAGLLVRSVTSLTVNEDLSLIREVRTISPTERHITRDNIDNPNSLFLDEWLGVIRLGVAYNSSTHSILRAADRAGQLTASHCIAPLADVRSAEREAAYADMTPIQRFLARLGLGEPRHR